MRFASGTRSLLRRVQRYFPKVEDSRRRVGCDRHWHSRARDDFAARERHCRSFTGTDFHFLERLMGPTHSSGHDLRRDQFNQGMLARWDLRQDELSGAVRPGLICLEVGGNRAEVASAMLE